MFYLGTESLAKRTISLEYWIHPDGNAAFVIFCSQNDIKMTGQVVDQ